MLVLGSIRKGDAIFSINLTDAYFQVPIHPDSQSFLQIVLNGKVHQFWAFCFGLSSALQAITRMFALISEWAHQREICLLHYLDDLLVVAKSIPLLLQHRDLLLQLCQDLVIVISWETPDLELSRRAQYFKMLMDTIRERVFPTDFRITKFRDLVDKFFRLPSPPAKILQQLLGHLAVPGVLCSMASF